MRMKIKKQGKAKVTHLKTQTKAIAVLRRPKDLSDVDAFRADCVTHCK